MFFTPDKVECAVEKVRATSHKNILPEKVLYQQFYFGIKYVLEHKRSVEYG